MKISKVFYVVIGMLALMLIVSTSCSDSISEMDKLGKKSILKTESNYAELGELGWITAIHYDVGLRVFDIEQHKNSFEGKIENVRDETFYDVQVGIVFRGTSWWGWSTQMNLFPGEVTEWVVPFDNLDECEGTLAIVVALEG